MIRTVRLLVTLFLIVGLVSIDGSALTQAQGHKEKEPKGQDSGKGNKDGKQQKAKKHKHKNGKDLVGDKIKSPGKHKFDQNGKNEAYVDVSKGGKIAGVSVKNADQGDVPVTKYKTTKKMAKGPTSGAQPVSLLLVQDQYIDTVWIGYGYIDEWGEEVIYWFPYDMILDGDTGAIVYLPVYE